MKRLRIYADTSVIGGCLDAEFADDSLRLIEAVRKGRFVLLLSDNQVNLLKGYGILTIISPKEVFTDEQENDEEI